MVDEELKLPKGSDSNLLTRMHKEYEKNKYYVKPRTAKPVFSINHYAGEVTYVIEGFLDKNKDQLSEDALDLIKSSSIYLVSKLVDNAFNTSQSNSLSSPTATLSRQKTMGVGGGIAANTVSAQFKEQLTGLMKTLNATNPQFVRYLLFVFLLIIQDVLNQMNIKLRILLTLTLLFVSCDIWVLKKL